MAVKVKICGLKTEAAVAAALDAGADYVGFVFYSPSPRSVSPDVAASLARLARGRARIVALFVDPDDALLDEVVRKVEPDLIQLHGKETPERVANIRARFGRPVMKAISVETRADADRALSYRDAANLFLFDAKAPRELAGALPGGNGIAFDWRALDGVRDKVRFMLSGGLNPGNVAEAIRLTAAEAVDVSSEQFIAAAKGASGRAKQPAVVETRSAPA